MHDIRSLKCLYLAIFCILGTFCRVYLGKNFTTMFFPDLYGLFIGCFCIGAFFAHKQFLVNNFHEIYVGVTSGFCGSLTTFSSWQFQSSTVLVHWEGLEPSDFESYSGAWNQMLGCITMLLIGMTLSYSAFHLGMWVSNVFPQGRESSEVTLPERSSNRHRDVLHFAFIFLFFGGLLLLCGLVARFDFFWITVFAPFGVLCRYQLARQFNKSSFYLPWGTLIANLFATLLVGLLFVWKSSSSNTGATYFIMGATTGFCGCLSTVSTFIMEVHIHSNKNLRHNFYYVVLSLGASQFILLIVNGSYVWS